MGTIALHFALFAVAVVLTWKGSRVLEDAASALSVRYGLPALVHGSLVVAVGSSFPELTTTVAAALIHGEFALGMASIVGSAIFNILVIPGICGLRRPDVTYDLRLVYRDAQFYLTSVATLLLAFSFALIYFPVESQPLTGELTRPIALLPIGLYGLYIFLQQQESKGEDFEPTEEGEPSDPSDPPAASPDSDGSRSALSDWARLLLGLVLVVGGVEGLLRTAIWLGDTLDTPSFLWGATVIAAATSIPDLLISVRSAGRGEGDVSLGNVLGSNIFDLLVAIPIGVLVAGPSPVDYGVAAPLMAALTLATIALFTMMRRRLTLTRTESTILLCLYLVFIGWMSLETAGVLQWLSPRAT